MRVRLHGVDGGVGSVYENSGMPRRVAEIICMPPLTMLAATGLLRQYCFIAVQP